MESKIKIFETGKSEGVMSRNKKFYPEDYTEEDINKQFLETRINIGKKYGFDGKKIFQAIQKTENNNIEYEDGKYVVLTEEHMKKEDYWYEEIPADILILSEKYKGIVVGNQMADCPILIIEDRKQGVTALSHCGASYVDRKLPQDTVKALIKEFNSNIEDLYVYIGSCGQKESYIYDRYPLWAKNKEVWEDCIIEKNGNYHLDLPQAIEKQIKAFNIKSIEISTIDTIKDDRYYSHNAAYHGNSSKKGQNFVGFFYK